MVVEVAQPAEEVHLSEVEEDLVAVVPKGNYYFLYINWIDPVVDSREIDNPAVVVLAAEDHLDQVAEVVADSVMAAADLSAVELVEVAVTSAEEVVVVSPVEVLAVEAADLAEPVVLVAVAVDLLVEVATEAADAVAEAEEEVSVPRTQMP